MTQKSNPAQLVAEYTAKVEDCERQYVALRDPLQRSLQKASEIRHAILTYEMELSNAMAKFQDQLNTIESNFNSLP